MNPNFVKEKENFIYILASILIFALLIFFWRFNNNYLPTSDAITYLQDAFFHYNSFIEKGFIVGINELYAEKGWRPQIYPIIITPFLLLTGVNPILTVTTISEFFQRENVGSGEKFIAKLLNLADCKINDKFSKLDIIKLKNTKVLLLKVKK